MKKLLAPFLALVMFAAVDASAQQRPQPLPTNTGNTSTTGGDPLHKPLPPLHYPAPASTYQAYVNFYAALLRQAGTKFNVAPGDIDKAMLLLKDCAARVQADGYVTLAEARYCRVLTMRKVHELAAPYMIKHAAEQ
jgi:hypothetical protein